MGTPFAIDGSDLPSMPNGQRFVAKDGKLRERYPDPDASWGHRSSISTRSGGAYYGYKVHAVVCATTGLLVAWQVETVKDAEVPVVPALLDRTIAHGFAPEYAMLDKGYDAKSIYEGCEQRGIRPIVPLRQTRAVKAGRDQAPTCEHGTWTFAGSDAERGAAKRRCPTGDRTPACVWIKADRLHPLVSRYTARFKGCTISEPQ